MIRIHYENEMFCPFVHCDGCGGRIENYRLAIATFDLSPDQNESINVRHLHKRCDDRRDPFWAPLEDHLLCLAYNSGVQSRDLKRAMRETCWGVA